MLESAWSEPQSDVTEELGMAMSQAGDGGAAVTRNPLRFCHHFANDDAAPRQRSVMPKAQPSSLNRSDQRVPVYWDQTVPVWEGGGGAASTAAKRKAASASRLQGRDSRRFGGGGADSSSDTASSGEYCACSGRDGGSWRGGGGEGDGGASSASSEVSFDAILSMYESSLGEKSLRRDGWVLSATVFKPRGHDTFRRRRTFAGRGLISVQL